jgi:ASC-1-like (ASCH) protein
MPKTKKNSILKKSKKTAKMAEQVMNVQNPWFNYIKEGHKTIEGRLNKGKFANLKVGDIVVWENAGKKIRTKLTRIEHYKSFSDMIINEGLRNVLPGKKTLNDGINVYRGFYSEAKEAEYGVLAIQVKLV